MALGVIFFFLLVRQECSSSVLDWFSWTNSPEVFSDHGVPLLQIPFEELTAEEKFLVEASKITGLKLDQLDACQHKLIARLKASCGSLSDEALAKLSVNLLNCQADVEGRKTYPCNENMSLRECTSGMDPETWNAYHIMSNRARAVCYVARQEQFRALAEMTVNRLVATARSHLQQMSTLNENQEKLEKATEVALERISRSQHDVLSSYSRLRRLESELALSLTQDKTGLDQLGAVLDNNRNEIIQILVDFKKAIEESESKLKEQSDIKLIEHEKMMEDLLETQNLIQGLNKQLGEINKMNTQSFEKAVFQFESSQKYLKAINKSLSQIYLRLETLEKITENKTTLLLSYIGYSGENLDLILAMIVHVVALSAAMLVASFLGIPRHLRAVLVAAGLLNTYLHISDHEYAIPVIQMYVTLAAVSVVDLLVLQAVKIYHSRTTSKQEKITERKPLNYTNISNGIREPYSKVNDWLTDKERDRKLYGLQNGTVPFTPITTRDEDGMSEHSHVSTRSRTRKNGVSPSRSLAGSSVSGRKVTCAGTRANGMRCKLPPALGSSRCRIHIEQS